MLFLELAAQAVRGFSPSIRLALKPGYTALKSPSDLPAPLSGLIVALSFPDGRGGDVAYLAPGQKGGRAGLSIQGNDGSVWRIVRDLGGAGGLHKLNRTTNQFEIVSQEAGEMGQSLRSGAGFPARTTWEQLFTLTGPQLPTRRPKGPTGPPQSTSGSMKSLPRVVSAWNMDGGGSGSNPAVSAEDAAKLPALEAELASAKRAAEVQFRLDGVNSELYEAETKTKAGNEVMAQLNGAKEELAAFNARISTLPDDILVRAQRHNDEKRKFDEQVQRVRDEMQAAQDNQPAAPAPLLKNQQFLAAIGVGIALYVGAAFLEGSLRWLALLAMIPFSLAALFALRHIEDLQTVSRQGGKGEVLAGREKKLTDDFQLASMVVSKALTQVGTSSIEEFLTFMGRKGELVARTAELESQLAAVQSDPEFIAVGEKLSRLKSEQEKLNQELLGMSGGYIRDVRDIEREIARIKEPPAAPKPAAPPPSSSGSGFAPVPTGPTENWEDPMPPLMLLATDLFTTDIPSLWSVLHDRSVQYVTALTDRRYHGIQLDKDGHATLEAPGRTVSAKELPGKDLDLIYLAMRLTLIEKAASQHKLPVVIEDTFNTVLDATKQPLFGRMVKHLGTLTQVLHVSGSGQNASLADTPVAI
ncbi:MAG: chromosome segregation protein SMC [Archangium sp.]|nr:chromosome segregation protein SMC [Archangium sp.]